MLLTLYFIPVRHNFVYLLFLVICFFVYHVKTNINVQRRPKKRTNNDKNIFVLMIYIETDLAASSFSVFI